jgi:putative flippase GtrA
MLHLIEKIVSRRFIRFLLVGGLNTLFGFLAYSAFIALGLPTWAALLAGNLAGIAFNFFTIGGMVFWNLSLSRVPPFVLCYLVIYLINLGLIDWTSALVGGRILAQAILALPMAVVAYLILRSFVFGKIAPPLAERSNPRDVR